MIDLMWEVRERKKSGIFQDLTRKDGRMERLSIEPRKSRRLNQGQVLNMLNLRCGYKCVFRR